MKNSVNISTDGMNLKQTLERYYGDNGFSSRSPVVFSWGIDFAYCGVEAADSKDAYLFIATDNHDGTARIEITDEAQKYLRAKKSSHTGSKQTEYLIRDDKGGAHWATRG